LVVLALGNAADVIADVALVCWNRLDCDVLIALDVIAEVALVCWNKLELLVAISKDELELGKAADVIADVALVCWNKLDCEVAISRVELELGNAAEVIADVALVCWNRLLLLVAIAFVVMFVSAMLPEAWVCTDCEKDADAVIVDPDIPNVRLLEFEKTTVPLLWELPDADRATPPPPTADAVINPALFVPNVT
jgi:hypothetical protein